MFTTCTDVLQYLCECPRIQRWAHLFKTKPLNSVLHLVLFLFRITRMRFKCCCWLGPWAFSPYEFTCLLLMSKLKTLVRINEFEATHFHCGFFKRHISIFSLKSEFESSCRLCASIPAVAEVLLIMYSSQFNCKLFCSDTHWPIMKPL